MRKNEQGYTVLIALLIVGFLIVLTSGIFKLVLAEMFDSRGRGDYLKAYYAAEGGIEWAMYKIKNFGYGYIDEIDLSPNNRSIVLAENPLDIGNFLGSKDVLLSYEIDTKSNSFSQDLSSGEHVLIPLFYVDADGVQHDAKKIDLAVESGSYESMVWNIIGNTFGVAGNGVFNNETLGAYKYTFGSELKFENKTIDEFLGESSSNYLLLFNSNPTDSIRYTLTSLDDDLFTKPLGDIYASGKIGSYKQNIKLSIDNTQYVNILKYSIFSN